MHLSRKVLQRKSTRGWLVFLQEMSNTRSQYLVLVARQPSFIESQVFFRCPRFLYNFLQKFSTKFAEVSHDAGRKHSLQSRDTVQALVVLLVFPKFRARSSLTPKRVNGSGAGNRCTFPGQRGGGRVGSPRGARGEGSGVEFLHTKHGLVSRTVKSCCW